MKIKKSVRYALVAPVSHHVVMDFGTNKDLMNDHIARAIERYGTPPSAMAARLTHTTKVERAESEEVHTEVGVTMFYNTSLTLTTDGNVSIHDRESDTYIAIGPATVSMLNALIEAAERLKVHAK